MPQAARSRTKACARCKAVCTTLYRVVHEAPKQWVLVCADCQASVAHQPLYRYGGPWKADKQH